MSVIGVLVVRLARQEGHGLRHRDASAASYAEAYSRSSGREEGSTASLARAKILIVPDSSPDLRKQNTKNMQKHISQNAKTCTTMQTTQIANTNMQTMQKRVTQNAKRANNSNTQISIHQNTKRMRNHVTKRAKYANHVNHTNHKDAKMQTMQITCHCH